jgi:peroxiredoxin
MSVLSISGLVVALGALGAFWLSPALGVALSFVGVVMTAFAGLQKNIPQHHIVASLALAANGTAVFLGSESVPLAIAAIFLAAPVSAPSKALLTYARGLFELRPLIGLVLGLTALLAAWPVGVWAWSVVPNIALLLFGTLLAGLSWRDLRAFIKRSQRIHVGDTIDSFTLPFRGGGVFDLADWKDGSLLLCFLRGDWCPTCQIMMRVYAREAARLAEHGISLIAVSPSEGAEAEELVKEWKLTYPFAVDRDAALAKKLGLLQLTQRAGADVPLPVALLIDASRRVVYISKPDDFTPFASKAKITQMLQSVKAV